MNNIFRFLFLLFLNFYFTIGQSFADENRIKIGLLIPLTGDNAELGKQIVKATRMALKDINSGNIEIYPKDTRSDPTKTLRSAKELNRVGIKLVIGPVFHDNLIYLDEVSDITFLSLTNKTLDLPKNVISTGVNSTSQINAIKKFIELNEIKKSIFLIPNLSYDLEIKKGIIPDPNAPIDPQTGAPLGDLGRPVVEEDPDDAASKEVEADGSAAEFDAGIVLPKGGEI